MTGPAPASVRLAKLRAVVSREGRDDVQQDFKQPDAKKSLGNSIKASGTAAEEAGSATAPKPKKADNGVRNTMIIAIVAWTLIMPLALVGIILARQGEGALPNLPLLTIIQSNAGSAVVNSVEGLWVFGLLYFLPSIVASFRRHPFFIWILLLNIVTTLLLLATNWAFGLWAIILGGSIWSPSHGFHKALGKMAGGK